MTKPVYAICEQQRRRSAWAYFLYPNSKTEQASLIFFFFFWFGFYSPSRLFHSFWAKLISRWGENGRSPRKTTWPPTSTTSLVSYVTPKLGSNPQRWDDERFRALKIRGLNNSDTGAAMLVWVLPGRTILETGFLLIWLKFPLIHVKKLAGQINFINQHGDNMILWYGKTIKKKVTTCSMSFFFL